MISSSARRPQNQILPVSALLVVLMAAGCAYRPFVGPLTPVEAQSEGMEVFDDGRVVYSIDRFEIAARPMTDAELNRQFSDASTGGVTSTNAYT